MDHANGAAGERIPEASGHRVARGGRCALPVVLVAVVGLGVGCLGPRVVVLPSGPGVTAAPRPSDCKPDFFRTRPDRPYDELAALHAQGGDTFKDGPGDLQDALRAKACELGADAVVVTQDFSGPGGTMNAVAIKYRARVADPR